MIRNLAAVLVFALAALPAAGFELTLLTGARQVSERGSPMDSYALPIAAFDGDGVPARVFEGRIERQTWRIDTPGLTTLQAVAPLREQLVAEGYQVVFECEDTGCGGFDFRFETEVVPAPDMYVDIRNYRFVSAVRGADEAVSLLVSRSRSAGYVQIVYVNRPRDPVEAETPAAAEPTPETAPDPAADDLIAALTTRGHAVLTDLVFETGADALDTGQYESLEVLAAYLKKTPKLVIAVVGHTDSIGALEGNIDLSRRRAQSVRARLIDSYDIDPARVQAEGMGYLAPVASNLTSEGREANRRVEVILLSDR